MILYSQRDPSWAELKLGDSPLTMGRYGCTTSCIAMLSTYFQPFIPYTPGSIINASQPRHLRYTAPGGLILWPSAKFEHFAFYRRVYERNDAEIQRHMKDPNLAVILEVANRSHWVVGVSRNPITGSYKIADPWIGDYATMARYKNDITGAAYFGRV